MAIQLTPHGHLVPYAAELALLPDAVARDLTARAAQSSADLLSWLGTRALTQPLPTAGVFWREWARTYFARLSREPARVGSLPVPDPGEVAERVLGAPPLPGGEYLTPDVLTRLWAELDARVLLAAGGHAGGVGGWLHEQNPVWNQVGRVMFHLAENKRDPAWPFAFLATYTHRISDQARPQHLPLGRALQEYAGGNQRSALVALLAPVERGAARSPFLRERVDSQRIFQPQRWTPREAHRFLSEVSALEDSGVQVRLPDWWRGGRPDRPTVSVTVGGRPAAGVGLDALLDFKFEVALGGEPLTAEEWTAVMAGAENLVWLKGRWVEIDRDKLTQVLAHWREVEAAHRQRGMSFGESLRLLSGATAGGGAPEAEDDAVRAWSRIQPGEWLRTTLAEWRAVAAATLVPAGAADAAPLGDAELSDVFGIDVGGGSASSAPASPGPRVVPPEQLPQPTRPSAAPRSGSPKKKAPIAAASGKAGAGASLRTKTKAKAKPIAAHSSPIRRKRR